jgi:hypothetical protein
MPPINPATTSSPNQYETQRVTKVDDTTGYTPIFGIDVNEYQIHVESGAVVLRELGSSEHSIPAHTTEGGYTIVRPFCINKGEPGPKYLAPEGTEVVLSITAWGRS